MSYIISDYKEKDLKKVTELIWSYIVSKEQDTKDKRIFWIKITKSGRKLLTTIHKPHIEFPGKLLSNFSEEEKLIFIDQIKYFGKNIPSKKGENNEIIWF